MSSSTSGPKNLRGKKDSATVAKQPQLGAETGHVLYQVLLDAVLDPTIAIDQFGTVVLASASVRTVLGWDPDELRGQNIKVLLPEPHHSLHDDYLANYRRTGQTHILNRTREFEVVHKRGQRLTCELSVARADMPGGAPPLFIGSFRDVTQRRLAEMARDESERRFHAIFDRSYQFMGLLELDGTVLEVNQTALDAVGARREDVIGQKFWDTVWWSVSEHERERLKIAIREAAEGKFMRFETVHRGRNGELLSVDFSLNPVRDSDGGVVLLIPEGRDISELKRAQRAETAMLRGLATIGESAAMLAHEIKNPITAVNVALRAVAKHLGQDDRVVLEDLVTRMQRLEGLMRRTLSFTRPLELRVGVIEAQSLVDQVVRALRPEIVKRGAEVCVDVDVGLSFNGDRQLLDEVLTNLLKNALEATGASARVILSAHAQPEGWVLLAVEDNGPGIPASLSATLFKPFTTTKASGTGLGLAFCRKVVEEHGGSIDVTRSALGGARFEIRLPSSP